MKKAINLYSLNFFLIFLFGGIVDPKAFYVPIWFFWIFPLAWLILLPIYFLFYFVVIYYLFKKLHIKMNITFLKVMIISFILGFLADLLAIGILDFIIKSNSVINNLIFTDFNFYKYLIRNLKESTAISLNLSILNILMCTSIIISRIIFYKLNMKLIIERMDIDGENSYLAKYIAIFTAPYIFIIPFHWFI